MKQLPNTIYSSSTVDALMYKIGEGIFLVPYELQGLLLCIYRPCVSIANLVIFLPALNFLVMLSYLVVAIRLC